MNSLAHWWRAPGHYDWLSYYMRSRGAERQARTTVAAVTICLGAIPVAMLASPSGARDDVGRAVAGAVASACIVMGIMWILRWPTQTQSLLYVLAANACCSAGCLIVSNPLAGLSAATCFSMLAGYVAFFHSARVYVVTLSITAVTVIVLGIELVAATGDVVLAVCKVVLVILSVAAVPFVSQMLMAYLGPDVVESEYDPLTGLSNRRGFSRRVDELIVASRDSTQAGVPMTVMMIDLDDFKKVNDTHGHATGDRALKAVGEILRSCAPDQAVVARVGGEEFLIARQRGGDDDDVAERICREIAGAPFEITASLGVATGLLDVAHELSDGLECFIGTADAAMYTAKRTGGNRVVRHRAGLGEPPAPQSS